MIHMYFAVMWLEPRLVINESAVEWDEDRTGPKDEVNESPETLKYLWYPELEIYGLETFGRQRVLKEMSGVRMGKNKTINYELGWGREREKDQQWSCGTFQGEGDNLVPDGVWWLPAGRSLLSVPSGQLWVSVGRPGRTEHICLQTMTPSRRSPASLTTFTTRRGREVFSTSYRSKIYLRNLVKSISLQVEKTY